MLGLDAHDMEDLGDAVGYDEGDGRSEQFGLAFLRLAKKLEPGFVITVEPGIYFIPALIDSGILVAISAW
jgi:Xaa-Pro aminopeptidase